MTAIASGVTWQPFGALTGDTAGNGSFHWRQYTLNGAPQSINGPGLTSTYTVDVLGNLTALTSGATQQHQYDALNRLRRVDNASLQRIDAWTHDGTGNRLSHQIGTEPPVAYSYPSDSHRLSAIGGEPRGYDANGNLTVGFVPGMTSFMHYGDHNRPTGWVMPRVGSATFRHNARGERVSVDGTGGLAGGRSSLEVSLHGESGQRLATHRFTNGPVAIQNLIWLDDLPIAAVDHGVLHVLETDHLGTPRRATRPDTGAVTWTWDFIGSAFGSHPAQASGLDLELRFPGQHHDPATGLHYNYFRDYEPGTGRYVQSDPIGLEGGINTYAYVEGRPTMMVDPLGLKGWYCQRPLGKPPGTRGPPLFNHQYLCVTRADGTVSCGGLTTDGNLLSGEPRLTRPDEDYYDPKSCKEVDDDKDQCFEQCVLRNFSKPNKPRYGIGPLTDCQEYADDLYYGCKILCNMRKGGR